MQQLAGRWFHEELHRIEAAGDFESRLVPGTTLIIGQRSGREELAELSPSERHSMKIQTGRIPQDQ